VRSSASNIFRSAPLALVVSLLSLGCADSSWEAARQADTVAAYHQFLRDNPGSGRATEAEQRIAFLRVKARPGIAAFEEFERKFAGSSLVAELEPIVEPLYLDAARVENTPEAYRRFLSRFPGGTLHARARGDLYYVESVGGTPTAKTLELFLREYPDSDFAAEARATLDLLRSHASTAIESLVLRVDVASTVEEPERVRAGFASVVAREYEEVGIEVSLLPQEEAVDPAQEAWMHIDYREIPAPGTFGGRTLISQCRVRMFQRDQTAPIWDRTFEAPAEHLLKGAHGRDRTVFGNSKYAFWQEFFVPVSTWATSRTRVAQMEYSEGVVAIDVRGDRGAVLLAGGGIEYVDVASPAQPKVLARYRRGRDLARWTGVRVLPGDRVAAYGANGIEIVEFGGRAPTRLGGWEAPEVGVIRDASIHGSTLLAVGNKGAFAFRTGQTSPVPHRLVEGDYVGIAVRADRVYLVGATRLEVATPKQLLSHLTGTKIPLGDKLQARKARLSRDSLWLFGDSAVIGFDLRDADRPVPVARLDTEDLGVLTDVAVDGDHLYLLGDRGLQVTTQRGKRVSDAIQVAGDRGVASKGRYLIVAGGQRVDVVDVSPYQIATASPAER
jgi:hypothetical protein